MAHVGAQQAERGGDAGPAGDDDARDAELVGDLRRVHGPGAAERHQAEPARVVAAGDRDHAQRRGHVGAQHAHDGRRRVLDRQPERARHRPLDGGPGERGVERRAAAQEPRRVERAEHDVGVGDGRLVAAHAVGGRAGIGAGRLGADRERAEPVDARDRAAARADRADVDLRQRHGMARHRAAVAQLRLAADHERDVGGGAADVDGERVGDAGQVATRAAPSTPAAGPDEISPTGSAAASAAAGDPARGAHQVQRRVDAGRLQLRGQVAHVAADQRQQRRVDGGRGAARVLAHLGRDPGRARHLEPGASSRMRAARSSWSGLRNENRKATAIASAPDARI